MPAIHLTRLKHQTAQLVEYFHQPSQFLRELKSLFEKYADHTHRPTQASKPAPAMPAFNLPAPVMRQILIDLGPQIQDDPEAALALVDALWESGRYFEFRLLAALLLGHIPPHPPKNIITRLQSWGESNHEDDLLEALASKSVVRLKEGAPESFFQLIENWLTNPNPEGQKLGLRALLVILGESDFENLPAVYRLMGLLVGDAPSEIRPYLLDILRTLAAQSPQETLLFLRTAYEQNPSPSLTWLIRHSARAFPKKLQKPLLSLVKR